MYNSSIPIDLIRAVAQKQGWDIDRAEKMILRTQEVLLLSSPADAVNFLLVEKIVAVSTKKPRD